MKLARFIPYTALSLMGILPLAAQHNFEWYSAGALVSVNGAELHVLGDAHFMGNSTLEQNGGLIKVQGNLYSSNTFQQRGAGVVRLENNLVNQGETQFISGSFAVRGGQAQIGVNDGSFEFLELANDQGIVWLNGTGNVADVRSGVDFFPAGAVQPNRIVTGNPVTVPANGSVYPAVFGMMRPAPGANGIGFFINNTVDVGGTSSPFDHSYIQGRLRRAISPAGGLYGFVLGLEPNGAGTSRGFQYVRLNFGANNYDVVEGYFQQGSPNNAGSPTECSGYLIDYYGGADHGEWVLRDLTGTGTGLYSVQVWPQDDNLQTKAVWLITKDDAIAGTPDECGGSPVGLLRSGFNGFSEFAVAGADIILSVYMRGIEARPQDNRFIELRWDMEKEQNVRHYEIERSLDGRFFAPLTTYPYTANQGGLYRIEDYAVEYGLPYYYRVKTVQQDGGFEYSRVVTASLLGQQNEGRIRLFPNPATQGQITFELETAKAEDLQLEVYDVLGRRLYELQGQAASGINQYIIPVDKWPAATYFLRYRSGEEVGTRQFIKP